MNEKQTTYKLNVVLGMMIGTLLTISVVLIASTLLSQPVQQPEPLSFTGTLVSVKDRYDGTAIIGFSDGTTFYIVSKQIPILEYYLNQTITFNYFGALTKELSNIEVKTP